MINYTEYMNYKSAWTTDYNGDIFKLLGQAQDSYRNMDRT
jgi:hypothetical protein